MLIGGLISSLERSGRRRNCARFRRNDDISLTTFNSVAEHLNRDNKPYEQRATWADTYEFFLKVISVRIPFLHVMKTL